MPRSIENECLIELETNLFEFLNIEKVFNMDGRLIIFVYGGNLYGWDELDNKGVTDGHCREFESSEVGFRFQRRR